MNAIPKNQSVVFINQASGYLMVDIINKFDETGFQCVLITGSLVERNQPLNDKVNVRKIVKYNNSTLLSRIFTWGFGTLQIFFIIKFFYRNSHLFIVSNPPTAILLPLILANSFTLLIFDVYPDAITELGLLSKNSSFIRLWIRSNKKVFARSSNIFTITEGMKELLKTYAGAKEIKVVQLWSDNQFLTSIPEDDNPFIKQNNLSGKFVVLYSGNIGLSNHVEVLVDIAKIVNSEKIIFVIIGNGAKKKLVQARVKEERIDNILILPWQETARLPYTLSSANIAVVTLSRNESRLAIPSKLFSLLPVGVPILGIAGLDSDLNQFIEKHKIGRCFLPENKTEIAEFIHYLASNPGEREVMKANALKASLDHTNKNVLKFLSSNI